MSAPPVTIADLRELARRRLPRMVFDFVDGGAEDEVTLRANREAFAALALRPRVLVDVAERPQAVTRARPGAGAAGRARARPG